MGNCWPDCCMSMSDDEGMLQGHQPFLAVISS